MNGIKICIIGAGSPYTPELIERLAELRERLPVSEIALMDIDPRRLEIMYGFVQRYAKRLDYPVLVSRTTDRKVAIEGACFINTQIRVGGNEARVRDEKIPLARGLIGQETTGAGGFAKGLRTVPAMLDIARDVEALAPDAWIINYTNPTGMVTEAVTKYTSANIAGLCAGGMFGQDWVHQALGMPREAVRYDYLGLNHMSFTYNVTVNGRLLTPEEFRRVAACVGAVDQDLILKLGALPSPYLQHYYHTARRVAADQKAPQTRGEVVQALERELYRDFADPAWDTKPDSLKKRGGGGYSEIATKVMHAIYNNQDTWAVVNAPNRRAVSFLPEDAVVETACMVNAAGCKPLVVTDPPKAVWGLVAAVKNYEQLAVEAAVTGDFDTAVLTLMAHPLVRDYDIAEPLCRELIQANKEYLPQFKDL